MRILILEDSDSRRSQFLNKIPSHFEVWFCSTAEQCITALINGMWDWLCLDHDLEPVNGVYAGTGYDVAKFLEEHPEHRPSVVLVHSANTVGWNNIKAAIPTAVKAKNLWEYVDEVIQKLNL